MQQCPYLLEMKERLLFEYNLIRHIDDGDYEHNTVRNIAIMSDNSGDSVQVQQPLLNSYGSAKSQVEMCPQPQHNHNSNSNEEICSFYHHKVVKDKNWPKNAKTSLFIIMSFLYAKLLVVACIGYVVSDVLTHTIPLYYYEGFFTYLYGMSIIFLLYVFCFLLQESSCCTSKKPVQKKVKAEPEKKLKVVKEKKKDSQKSKSKAEKKAKKEQREKFPRKKRDQVQDENQPQNESELNQNAEAVPAPVEDLANDYDSNTATLPLPPPPPVCVLDAENGEATLQRKRKTSQSHTNYGSVFLRVGAIVFGLGTMIYIGLELGSFFEIPFDSPCHHILKGVNPGLQMIFTFMQMYFIFMNARLNIHRFKLISRFGLMHIVATNICIWIRTLVYEYLKDLTYYFERTYNVTDRDRQIRNVLKSHIISNANGTLGRQLHYTQEPSSPSPLNVLQRSFREYPEVNKALSIVQESAANNKTVDSILATTMDTFINTVPPIREKTMGVNLVVPITTTEVTTLTENITKEFKSYVQNLNLYPEDVNNSIMLDRVTPAALTSAEMDSSLNCNRINIMGSIVQDSAPYLYPFIINYCLIGAVVIYVMWKHIGRYQRLQSDEDLEHKLEVMLSRRAVAMAQASQSNRVDCIGTSKGLFFGLLMLVGAIICLILFFVLIHQPDLGLLAIYLAEGSHCAIVALSIVASLLGFIRIRKLRFRVEEPTNLNDLLLRISAFGLFVYMALNIVSGALHILVSQPDMLIVITGVLTVVQVVLQLLFIGDVSRRRVHLPEHDRSKPGRQIVTFLLIANLTLWIIYTFEIEKVEQNPIQLNYYGYISWTMVQKAALPLTIFHRFHSAVTLAEIWKTTYKASLD